MDVSKIPPADMAVLQSIAAGQGKTVEQVLQDMGHTVAAETKSTPAETVESVVVFDGEPTSPVIPQAVMVEDDTVVFESPDIVEEKDPPPPPMAEERDETENHTHMATLPHKCVHCGWDQKLPAIAEPSAADKLAFLQSVLGQTAYEQRYSLFGGKLKITLRTLNIREIDAIYAHTFAMQQRGEIRTTEDYYEIVNRCRVYLQLIAVSGAASPLHIKLPVGFDSTTNTETDNTWEKFLGATDTDKSLFDRIIDYMTDHVMKTEHLQRAVTQVCAKFNRSLAKMEACIEDPDFWSETDQPS